jgi:hypothetical protein
MIAAMSTSDRTKPDESGSGHGQPGRVWLPLGVAAERLGITHDTARKRLERGHLVGEKRGGRWFVAVAESDEPRQPDRTHQDEPRRGTRQPDARPDKPDALIGHLVRENAWLRGQLEERSREVDARSRELASERERADVLMRESLRRIEALSAGAPGHDRDDETSPESAVTHDVAPGTTIAPSVSDEPLSAPAEPSKRVGWWSRIFGRVS